MQKYLNKTTIIIAGVVVILIIAAVFFFGRKSPLAVVGVTPQDQFPSSTNNPDAATEPTPTPAIETNIQNADSSVLAVDQIKRLPVGTLIKLTDEQISSIATYGTTTARYNKNIPDALGHLYERNADGSSAEVKISNFTIPQVMKVVWAAGGTKAVVFYNLSGIIKKVIIDYKSTSTPKTSFLPDSVSDVALSPDGKSMAFINDLGDTRNIFTATSDFKNQKKILDNIIPGFELSWPGAKLLALKTKSSYAVMGYLYSVSASGGPLNKVAGGFGLDAVWNKDGSGVLVSTVTSGGAIQPLKYIDIKTSNEKEVGLNTIAEKCAFSNITKEFFYCGAPGSGANAKYPDAWWQGNVSFRDAIYGVNGADGTITPMATSDLDVVMSKTLKDDSFLIFQDKTTGFLWSMKAK